jgi:manganese/zinc/iron transport system substrate-binding protein
VATTGPVAELVRRVGGRHVQVEALMGPGIDPHLYRPTLADARRLAEADAIFYNGLHLEGRMTELFAELERTRLAAAVTAGLVRDRHPGLREAVDMPGTYDPHVWHDPLLWAECARETASRLAAFDEDHAADYAENATAAAAELAALDAACREQLARIPPQHRVLVTAHDAFAYFGKTFGLEVAGLKGLSTEEEKDPRRQEAIQAMILQRRLPAVFVESAVAPRTIESLVEPCRASGHDLRIGGELYADALGPADSEAATYAGMIRRNVRTIVDALATAPPDAGP